MSVLVQNLTTGEIIDNYRSDKVVPPASVMKLLTTGAALETLGPDYRFTTTLEYTGNIEQGTLYGNLYIHGGCDPSLGWRGQNAFLNRWVKAVKEAGLRLDLEAPTTKYPSITAALNAYIEEQNKKKK